MGHLWGHMDMTGCFPTIIDGFTYIGIGYPSKSILFSPLKSQVLINHILASPLQNMSEKWLPIWNTYSSTSHQLWNTVTLKTIDDALVSISLVTISSQMWIFVYICIFCPAPSLTIRSNPVIFIFKMTPFFTDFQNFNCPNYLQNTDILAFKICSNFTKTLAISFLT